MSLNQRQKLHQKQLDVKDEDLNELDIGIQQDRSEISKIDNNIKNTGIDASIQWTCSNISIFYLITSYNIIKNNFSKASVTEIMDFR